MSGDWFESLLALVGALGAWVVAVMWRRNDPKRLAPVATPVIYQSKAPTLKNKVGRWIGPAVAGASMMGLFMLAIRVGGGIRIVYDTAPPSGAVSPTEAAAAPAPELYPNEPPSFQQVTIRTWDTRDSNGWTSTIHTDSSDFTIVNDPTAPVSCCNVAEARYRPGTSVELGGSPMTTTYLLTDHVDSLYFSTWVKWSASPPFQGNPAGINKCCYTANGNGAIHGNSATTFTEYDTMYFSGWEPVNGDLVPNVQLNGDTLTVGPDERGWAYSNVANGTLGHCEIVRGQWHQIEELVIRNYGASATNGEWHAWIDGQKCMQYADINWASAEADQQWEWVEYTPVWGGGVGTLDDTIYHWMDHYYASANYLPSIEWAYIAAGAFDMGGTGFGETIHHVILTQDYWISKHEITQEEYEFVMGSNPSPATWTDPQFPVTDVVYDSAIAFVNALSTISGLTVALPTEAEWEFAARERGVITGPWMHGAAPECADANVSLGPGVGENPCIDSVAVVGGYAPTADSLFDMMGNAWEWTNDWYAVHTSDTVTDPTGPGTGTNKVMKGFAYYHQQDIVEIPGRGQVAPPTSNDGGGFRIVVRQTARPW